MPLVLDRQYLELLWVEDDTVARSNRLRLDRRADYRHCDGLPFPVWVQRDDARARARAPRGPAHRSVGP